MVSSPTPACERTGVSPGCHTYRKPIATRHRFSEAVVLCQAQSRGTFLGRLEGERLAKERRLGQVHPAQLGLRSKLIRLAAFMTAWWKWPLFQYDAPLSHAHGCRFAASISGASSPSFSASSASRARPWRGKPGREATSSPRRPWASVPPARQRPVENLLHDVRPCRRVGLGSAHDRPEVDDAGTGVGDHLRRYVQERVDLSDCPLRVHLRHGGHSASERRHLHVAATGTIRVPIGPAEPDPHIPCFGDSPKAVRETRRGSPSAYAQAFRRSRPHGRPV